VSWMNSEEFDEFIKRMRELERKIRDYVESELERALRTFSEELRQVEDTLRPMWHHEGYLRPLYSIRDRGSYIEVFIDLPKADEKTIEVKFRENYMYIKAKLREEVVFHGVTGRGGETRFHEYREVIELPFKVDPEKVRVDARKGRVKIIIHK